MTIHLRPSCLLVPMLCLSSCGNGIVWHDSKTDANTHFEQLIQVKGILSKNRCKELAESSGIRVRSMKSVDVSSEEKLAGFLFGYIGVSGMLSSMINLDTVDLGFYRSEVGDTLALRAFGFSDSVPCFVSFQIWSDARRISLDQRALVISKSQAKQWVDSYYQGGIRYKDLIQSIQRQSTNTDTLAQGVITGKNLDSRLFMKLNAPAKRGRRLIPTMWPPYK